MRFCISLMAMGLIGLISSCSKFLEETSQSELVPRSAESLNEYLLGEGYPKYDERVDGVSQYLDDDVNMFKFPSATHTKNYDTYTWQAKDKGMSAGAGAWVNLYARIQTCNTVLEYLPKVSGEQQMKDYVAGQALLLRAYYYTTLVNFFGAPYNDPQSDPKTNLAVPLMIKAGIETVRKSRNTVAEVYAQIEKDITEGIRLVDQGKKNHSNYRIGGEAGHLLASRVYLYMEKWDEVIKHTDVLLNKSYQLNDLRTWGTVDPKTKRIGAATNPETIWAFGSMDYNRFIGDDAQIFALSTGLINMYTQGDLRNGIYLANGISVKLPKSGQYISPTTGRSLRLSEAYLNRAEALAYRYKQGAAAAGQECILLLNQLREKRFSAEAYTPWALPTSGDELLQYVRDERRRELFKEEDHRWFDLRRYGMPSVEHTYFVSNTQSEIYILEKRDPAYILPIPSEATRLNPNLVQNPLVTVRQPK